MQNYCSPKCNWMFFGNFDHRLCHCKKQTNNKIEISFLLKGSIIILAPIIFHYKETYEIFSLLFLNDSFFLKTLNYIKYFDITNAYDFTFLKSSLYFFNPSTLKFSIIISVCVASFLTYFKSLGFFKSAT